MTGLSLTVLGCSGSYAAAGEACSGYLVQSSETNLWVDCDPGTLANLQRNLALNEVDAIVVSHHHPDHCAELPVVYNAYKYFTSICELRVISTSDVRRVTDAFQPDGDSSDFFSWEIVADGSVAEVGDISICFSQTDHPVETLAMRFSCGEESIVYTSDTGQNWSISELGFDANIVIGEGTLLDGTADPAIPHISCRHLALEANEAGARQLIVTHVPPGSDPSKHLEEASAVFEGRVELATTGRTFSATNN